MIELTLYDNEQNFIAEQVLNRGDILVIANGGRGFKTFEDTILLEIKQGPYTELAGKVHIS